MGWIAPSMAVTDGTMDCAARWSLMASGDGMAYASGLCYGGLPVMVGWVASLVAIADSTTTELQNTLIRLFMPVCIVLCSFFLFVCTKHAMPV